MASAVDKSLGTSRHEHLIRALAKENSASEAHVRELFELEHARLQAGARVKTFVAVLATRLVRNALHAERDRTFS